MSEEHSFKDIEEEDLDDEKKDEIPSIPNIPGVTFEKQITEDVTDIPEIVSDEPISEKIPEIPKTTEIDDPSIDPSIPEEYEELPQEEVIEGEMVDEKLKEEDPEEIVSEDKSLDMETLESVIEESKEQMKTKPSKKVITLSIVFTLLSFLMTLAFALVFNILYLEKAKSGALPWFPGNFIVEIMVMWILPIAMFFLIIPLFNFFAKLYIRLHKLIKLRRFNYSVIKLKDGPIKFKEALGRMIIPLLFLYSIGYWVGNWIFPKDLDPYMAIQMLQYFLYSFLFSPIVVLLAIPLWLLEDSGVIALKKRKEGERKLPDVEGVNNYFHNLFTGSALSIAVVTLVSFIIASSKNFEGALFGAIAYVFLVLAAESISFVYLFELFMLRAKKRLLKRLPVKLVDMEPKVVVNLKDVNNTMTVAFDEEEDEPIEQY